MSTAGPGYGCQVGGQGSLVHHEGVVPHHLEAATRSCKHISFHMLCMSTMHAIILNLHVPKRQVSPDGMPAKRRCPVCETLLKRPCTGSGPHMIAAPFACARACMPRQTPRTGAPTPSLTISNETPESNTKLLWTGRFYAKREGRRSKNATHQHLVLFWACQGLAIRQCYRLLPY